MGTRARLLETGYERDLAFEPFQPQTPGSGQVLVEVDACGVCYRDLVDRDGRFPWLQLPVTPGHEAAGRVVAVGPDVTRWAVGDRVGTLHRDHCGECPACRHGQTSLCPMAAWVFGLLADGCYASHVLAPENALYALPPDGPAEGLCTLHCTAGTAYRGLAVHGDLQAGQRVLVTGANGGVGGAAIQVAKRMGADVTAVVRHRRHGAFVESLGADTVVISDEHGFHRRMPAQVDLALDCVGSPTFNCSLRSLRMGGRVIVIGNVVETRASLNLGYAIINGLHIIGSSGATADDMQALLALHARAPLDFDAMRAEVLPLSQADQAQRKVLAGGLQGRIVLDCR